MKVHELRKQLAGLPEDASIVVSSDEELNMLYLDAEVGMDEEHNRYILYPLGEVTD